MPNSRMVVVVGEVTIHEDSLDEALTLSLEHVHRSRTEPGCLAHGVHRDVENDRRLVFVERWSDIAALMQHFAKPTSVEFVTKISRLADEAPRMSLYEASELETTPSRSVDAVGSTALHLRRYDA